VSEAVTCDLAFYRHTLENSAIVRGKVMGDQEEEEDEEVRHNIKGTEQRKYIMKRGKNKTKTRLIATVPWGVHASV
jgi:hypothetical protein